MNITLIAGARPNFMKIAPLIHAIQKAEKEGKDIENYDYAVTNNVARTCADAVVHIIESEHLKVSRQNLKNLFVSEE